VRAWFDETLRLHQETRAAGVPSIVAVAEMMSAALRAGGKILVFGNGGSAADAQHFAAELMGRFEADRGGLAAIALTTDTSVLTSVSNDSGFDRVFARQIEALGTPGDVAFGISTSGRSPNVVRALETARDRGMKTVALTGRDGGEAGRLVQMHLNVPDRSAAHVQEVHITILHALCALIERQMQE
jgi:D-sedoheptulose 7-phosphate isomerase